MAVVTLDGPANVVPTLVVSPSGDTSGATDGTRLNTLVQALRGKGGTIGIPAYPRLYTNQIIDSYPGIGFAGVGPLGDTVVNQSAVSRIQAVGLNGPVLRYRVDPLNLTWTAFPYVSNLSIFGTGSVGGLTSQDAILIDDSAGAILDARIDGVIIANMGGAGINLSGTGAKTRISGGYYIEHCISSAILGGTGLTWIDGGYMFDNANGLVVAGGNTGDFYLNGVVILNSKTGGWGINAAGAGTAKIFVRGGQIWSNPGGAINIPNGLNYFSLSGAELQNNGDATHPAVVCAIGADGFSITDNKFSDSRGGSAVANFVKLTQMQGVVDDNVFSGQSGAAIAVTSNVNNAGYLRDNRGFNPYGQITNPLDEPNRHFCGLTGNTATPVASTDYTIKEVDQFVSISGGVGLSITLKDPSGNTIQSGLLTLAGQYLPVGFKFNCGAFTGSPTVSSWAN